MTTQPETDTENRETKQPYEKPDVVYQAPLEAMASDCSASPGKNSCSTLYS